MNWCSIRLELARTRDFPEGSASRCYLMRLPLTDDGLIDESALKRNPAQATVRRFWPNVPDLSGYVIHTRKGWALSYKVGDDDDEQVYHLERHPLRVGEYITLLEPDGQQLPFRVANLKPLD